MIEGSPLHMQFATTTTQLIPKMDTQCTGELRGNVARCFDDVHKISQSAMKPVAAFLYRYKTTIKSTEANLLEEKGHRPTLRVISCQANLMELQQYKCKLQKSKSNNRNYDVMIRQSSKLQNNVMHCACVYALCACVLMCINYCFG